MVTHKILPTRLVHSVTSSRAIATMDRKARFGARSIDLPVGLLAHDNEMMLSDSRHRRPIESDRRGALEFVDILDRALADADRDWSNIESCLDIGCGYGRIVRELCRKLPSGTISVNDAVDAAARFTASEFGATRVPLVEAMGREYDGAFDLVYLLSIYTHLDRPLIEANLARVASLMQIGGVLVFTTHGKSSATMTDRHDHDLIDTTKLNAGLDANGFYHERHPYYQGDYGLSWMLADETQRLVAATAPDLELIAHHPLAVDGHQDVFVYRRR